jgi:hypothetical protein
MAASEVIPRNEALAPILPANEVHKNYSAPSGVLPWSTRADHGVWPREFYYLKESDLL